MSLPDWVDPGLLPPGRHLATLEDLYERCVIGAPHRSRREELFAALRTFKDVTRRVIGQASLWIDGDLITAKPEPPSRIDVILVPDDWDALLAAEGRDRDRVFGLLTLHDVVVGHPLYIGLEAMQPFAGELDSFLCYPGDKEDWHEEWSLVNWDDEVVSGAVKGYVEVRT